jgi:Alpha-L-arabinofuranosidase B (ABFB) domain/Ricin-type beta-trefoil lectin domain-like
MRQLTALVALSAGCSLHSLEYLERSDDSISSGAFAGTAGAGAGPGAAGEAPMAEAGAAGSEGPDARCDDGLVNGDETDVDCGGRACIPCEAAERCLMGTDCGSAICTNQVCQPPSCVDLARNGDETDVNCGGSCPPCSVGRGCEVGTDCASSSCAGSTCTVPQCDGITPDPGCPLLADSTAYSLRPMSAPTSCVDVAALGTGNGVAIQQYTCAGAANQTFWAVAATDGHFALRNALSGKCLQVRANSLAPDAIVEQSTCTGESNQLFLPGAAPGGMKLEIQSSGLSLDVAGAISTANGQVIDQGVDDGSADMRWVAKKAAGSAFVTLTALGHSGVLLRHVASVVRAQASLETDSQWRVQPGLAAPDCVSFESRDQPGAYLRHSNFMLWTDTSDGSLGFNRDATFCFRAPLSGSNAACHSLESINYPGRFITANDGQLRLQQLVDTSEFRQLATWAVGQRQ